MDVYKYMDNLILSKDREYLKYYQQMEIHLKIKKKYEKLFKNIKMLDNNR